MGDEECEFGERYSEYVKGTKFEWMYNPHSDYNPVICCHKASPFIIFHGVKDNLQCEKLKEQGRCPIGKKIDRRCKK